MISSNSIKMEQSPVSETENEETQLTMQSNLTNESGKESKNEVQIALANQSIKILAENVFINTQHSIHEVTNNNIDLTNANVNQAVLVQHSDSNMNDVIMNSNSTTTPLGGLSSGKILF